MDLKGLQLRIQASPSSTLQRSHTSRKDKREQLRMIITGLQARREMQIRDQENKYEYKKKGVRSEAGREDRTTGKDKGTGERKSVGKEAGHQLSGEHQTSSTELEGRKGM